jgi:hypothetical protein
VSRYELDWVTDNLAVGQAPMSHEDLESIKRLGVDAVMNLCAEFCDLHWIEADSGLDVYYFPIDDEQAPDLEGLEKALDWLDEAVYLGKKVLIHCRYGIGRTGTVLNAYLLRKGLGQKMVKSRLKGLKSKPANFDQWWFLRKYRKKEKELTIREPALETGHLVDLFPFFADYEAALEAVDSDLARLGPSRLCGQDHDRCCRDLVAMGLAPAVYLSHMMNANLSRHEREGCIQRAVAASREWGKLKSRLAEYGLNEDIDQAWRDLGMLCPLNQYGECLLFDHRPLACRLHDLPPDRARALGQDLEPGLDDLSRSLFLAFTRSFAPDPPLSFTLPEVVSGKFVQVFFHRLMQAEDRTRAGEDESADGS